MLRRKRTFARLKKSSYLGKFLRLERAAKSRHVDPAVHDADHNVTLSKCVSDVSEIRTATSAVAFNKMAIETAFGVKKFCALEDRAARCANDFFRQRLRVEVWRPRRIMAGDPERADHDYAEQNHCN